MTAQDVIFRRKGTRVIYPYTDANAKNPGLISMSIAEAQDEGLLGPRTDQSAENNEISQLRAQNEELRAKLDGLLQEKEDAAIPPPAKVTKKKVTKKKVAAKVVTPVTVETEVDVESEEDEDSELKSSLSKLGIQMDD